jgi:DeoR/GlpR family transcriptional regulator of sugar metabolism
VKTVISEQRSAVILKEIETRGSVSVAVLSRGLGVSEMTIRRDLLDLEKGGFVRRVHGGAVSSRGRSYEPSLGVRSSENPAAKEAIGRRAASLVADGDSIAIDSGTTALELARNLVGRHNLTVVTPSLLVANVLSGQQDIKLVLTGGIVRPGEGSLVGDLAQQAFQGLFLDRLFLGVGAIDAKAGLSEYNWDDTLVKRAMIHTTKEVIVLADASKFGRVAFAQIAPLSSVHQIVTDQALSSTLAKACAKHSIVVHVTGNEEPEGYDQNSEED